MRASDKRTRNVRRTFECIKPYVQGKSVLDIGCVAHDASKRHNGEWMHSLIASEANDVMGVDILEEELTKLDEEGYNVEYGDAQNLSLDAEFDVIVVGELIEHLTNIGGLFESISEHLHPEGQCIITTPNAMAVHWTGLRLLNVEFINSEHTCWFDSQTLTQLMGRYGFSPVNVQYVGDCQPRYDDPLLTVGWACERALPDRIGKSTLVMVGERTDN